MLVFVLLLRSFIVIIIMLDGIVYLVFKQVSHNSDLFKCGILLGVSYAHPLVSLS